MRVVCLVDDVDDDAPGPGAPAGAPGLRTPEFMTSAPGPPTLGACTRIPAGFESSAAMANQKQSIHDKQGGVAVLLIDPQVDFHPGGSLAIETANDDSDRLAKLIRENPSAITQITVTLDTHQRLHIANPLFWKDAEGANPNPFTIISAEDVENGTWKPSRDEHAAWALEYAKALEAGGKYKICVWPEHCLVGTPGHAVVPQINAALLEWSARQQDVVEYVWKGTNPFTEMYSGLKAEVLVPGDPTTGMNLGLVDRLLRAERVLVGGEAMSHCVNATVRDLADAWPAARRAQIVVLRDGASAVPGFEAAAEKFLADMAAMGCTVCTCAEAFA